MYCSEEATDCQRGPRLDAFLAREEERSHLLFNLVPDDPALRKCSQSASHSTYKDRPAVLPHQQRPGGQHLVISSPSRSTTGLSTLIFPMVASCRAATAGAQRRQRLRQQPGTSRGHSAAPAAGAHIRVTVTFGCAEGRARGGAQQAEGVGSRGAGGVPGQQAQHPRAASGAWRRGWRAGGAEHGGARHLPAQLGARQRAGWVHTLPRTWAEVRAPVQMLVARSSVT